MIRRAPSGVTSNCGFVPLIDAVRCSGAVECLNTSASSSSWRAARNIGSLGSRSAPEACAAAMNGSTKSPAATSEYRSFIARISLAASGSILTPPILSEHLTPPEPGLSLVGCGYTPVGESVHAVRGKAGAGVALEVSAPQQLLHQGMAFASARVHAYAECRSTHLHVWGWLPKDLPSHVLQHSKSLLAHLPNTLLHHGRCTPS